MVFCLQAMGSLQCGIVNVGIKHPVSSRFGFGLCAVMGDCGFEAGGAFVGGECES